MERRGGRGGLEEEALRSFWSQSVRFLDSGADCALGEMSHCTILRRARAPAHIHTHYMLHAAAFLHPL